MKMFSVKYNNKNDILIHKIEMFSSAVYDNLLHIL